MPKNQDRTDLCHFVFTDGRRCQLPQSLDDMGLCYFHAQKYRDHIRAQEAGRHIADFLDTDVFTASELNSAFAALFSATARGLIKPKTTTSLAYLGQLMLQTQRLAKREYLQSFQAPWPHVVQQSRTFAQPDPGPFATVDSPEPGPEPQNELQDQPAQDDSASTSHPAAPLSFTKAV